MMKLFNTNIIKTIALCLLLQSNGMPTKNAQVADEFYVFNVGQGNCNLFIPGDPKSGIILYDAGSTAGPFNKKIQRTGVDTQAIIDIITSGFEDKKKQHLEVVVSHADLDHLKYIQSIIQEVTETVEDLNVVINFGGNKNTYTAVNAKALIKFIEKKKKKIKAFYPSNRKIPDYYDMGLDTAHDTHILNWSKGSPNPNIDSLVLRISSENHDHSVLLTGDAENATFSGLTKKQSKLLTSSILVAPHHGATKDSNSENFISLVQPAYVVFSAGVHGSYNHPTKKVVKRYLNSENIEMEALIHIISLPYELTQDDLKFIGTQTFPGKKKLKYYFYLTKAEIYLTMNGTLKFLLSSTIKIKQILENPFVGMFPPEISNTLTKLTLSNMELNNYDLLEIAKHWLKLKKLACLDIRCNSINLRNSKVNESIFDLIESLSEIKNHDFTIKMLPQKVKQKKS